ncbi:MAG: flagellar hook-length control protein FliK [Bdellovibrionaceae bacterium]|nr:flagellar hook-length control protein FliK [Bdellovibrionales bacterium]MCB9253899.1 flagellar hook-length control protein FliK [Pseudobdellovibrionaceae bacterium]
MEITPNTTRPVEPEAGNQSETEKLKKDQTDVDFMSYLLGLPNGIPQPIMPQTDFNPQTAEDGENLFEVSGDPGSKLMLNLEVSENPKGENSKKLLEGLADSQSDTKVESLAELMKASEKEVSELDLEKGIQKYLESAAQLQDTQSEAKVDEKSALKLSDASWLPVSSDSPTSADYVGANRVTEKPAMQESNLQELFDGVQSLVHRGGGKMTVSLSPEHLGQMEIEVNAKGNRVSVEMISQSHSAKAAIESQLADLRTAMQSQDLILARVQVQVGNEGRWASNANTGDGQAFQSNRRGSTLAAPSLRVAASSPIRSVGMVSGRLGTGRLDMRI